MQVPGTRSNRCVENIGVDLDWLAFADRFISATTRPAFYAHALSLLRHRTRLLRSSKFAMTDMSDQAPRLSLSPGVS